jgi:hypothetical protein
MVLAYAPIDEDVSDRPPLYIKETPKKAPVIDNTECNYICYGLLAGLFS